MLASEVPGSHPCSAKLAGGPILTSSAQHSNVCSCPIGNPKPSSSLAYPHHSLPQVPVLQINDVAIQFLRQYYTMLSRETDKVHFFYKDQSYSHHGVEGDQEVPLCLGLEKIHHRINSLGYSGCRVFISNIDCQPSINGGIMIMTVGKIHLKSGSIKRFAQTVFLAEQPSGYYVLNDIFRFINVEPGNPVPVEKGFIPPNKADETVVTQSPGSLSCDYSSDLSLKNEADFLLEKKTATKAEINMAHLSINNTRRDEERIGSWASLTAIQDKSIWGSELIVPESNAVQVNPTATNEPNTRHEDGKNNGPSVKEHPEFLSKGWKPFDPACSIYVGGLKMDPKPSESVIRGVFSPYGEIKTVDWGKDCVYVEFIDTEAPQKLHNKFINVCGVSVKILPRRHKQPGQRFFYRQQKNNSKPPSQVVPKLR